MEKLSVRMKHAVLFAAMGTLALFAQGCKDDTLGDIGDGNGGDIGKGTGYVALHIITDTGSSTTLRSNWNNDKPENGDFDPGDEAEYTLAPDEGAHRIFFFNKDGSYHSSSNLIKNIMSEDVPSDGEGGTGIEANKEKVAGIYVAQVPQISEGALPATCAVMINGRPSRLDALAITMSTFVPGSDGESNTAEEYLRHRLTDKLTTDEVLNEGPSAAFYTVTNGAITNYCTMSNSVYVEQNDKESIGEEFCFNPLKEQNFFATEEEAKNAKEGQILIVHVERMAAKVEVTYASKMMKYNGTDFKDPISADNPTGVAYPIILSAGEKDSVLNQGNHKVKWAALMWGWSLNGENMQEYTFKNLDDTKNTTYDGEFNHEYTEHFDKATKKITASYFDWWNDGPRYRSYWAVDAAYRNPNIYPTQYRNAKDALASTRPYEDVDKKVQEKCPLYYYSYQDIRMRISGYQRTGTSWAQRTQLGNLLGSRKYRYCLENTLGQPLLEGNNYQGASTHAIFIAQLLFNDEIQKVYEQIKDISDDFIDQATSLGVVNGVSDKYYSNGYFYNDSTYRQECYNKLYKTLTSGEKTIKDVFGGGSNIEIPILSTDENAITIEGKILKSDSFEKDKTIRDLFKLIKAEVVNGDGEQMFALAHDSYTLKLKSKNGGETTINADQFKSLVYSAIGVAYHYMNGRMYYYVPIRHLNNDHTPGNYKVGDFGVVRNHWYKLEVAELVKPGIPVSDPTQPIIPNVDPEDRYIGVNIHIIPWHVINQDITLQ